MSSSRVAMVPRLLAGIVLVCLPVLVSCATGEDTVVGWDTWSDPTVDSLSDGIDTSGDSWPDTWMDTIPDTWFDTWADTVGDTLGDTSADTVWDTGYDTVTDTVWDTGYDTVTDTGWDTGTDTAVDTVTDTGWDTGTDTAVDTVTDTGWDTGTDTAVDTVTDTGWDTGTDTAVDTVTDTGWDGTGGYTWTESFDGGSMTAQCTSWGTFRAGLATSGYTGMNLSGTFDTTGVTCSDPAIVQQYADALRTGTEVFLTCGGRVWALCDRGSHYEMWVDAPSLCDLSNCPDPGYIIRPCFSSSGNWCGVNSDTCFGPNQTITYTFY